MHCDVIVVLISYIFLRGTKLLYSRNYVLIIIFTKLNSEHVITPIKNIFIHENVGSKERSAMSWPNLNKLWSMKTSKGWPILTWINYLTVINKCFFSWRHPNFLLILGRSNLNCSSFTGRRERESEKTKKEGSNVVEISLPRDMFLIQS